MKVLNFRCGWWLWVHWTSHSGKEMRLISDVCHWEGNVLAVQLTFAASALECFEGSV